MKQQAIDILDEMIEEYDHKMYLAFCWNPAIEIDKEAKAKLIEAKSRIQALWDGVPTITIPEWTVLLGKDEYELLKEKAWRYDDLSNS